MKLPRSARRPWSAAEESILRAGYPDTPTADLAKRLKRSLDKVYQKAARLGLKKSDAYLASPAACRLRRGDDVGKATRFSKGQVPANKGLRRPGWAPGKMASTQFKPGQKPLTWQPIGTERYSKEGYLQRKVTDFGNPSRRDWKAVHVLVWESANGPVPRGHAVVFRDGNNTHIRIDNLDLLSRAELMRRNTYHNWPKPLAELVQLKGAVRRQINRKLKELKEERQ